MSTLSKIITLTYNLHSSGHLSDTDYRIAYGNHTTMILPDWQHWLSVHARTHERTGVAIPWWSSQSQALEARSENRTERNANTHVHIESSRSAELAGKWHDFRLHPVTNVTANG